jgi:hypothetical protein
MKLGIFQILIFALPLAGQASNVRVQVSNTQAVLSYTAPDSLPCALEVSESQTYTPLVHDVDTAIFLASNSDSRAGNISIGRAREFVAGKRDIEFGNAGSSSGKYFSRALEANTRHYYRLTCTGGAVTGTFATTNVPFGNTFGEPFQGDLSNPGNAPYPYLDPTVRNSYYSDPQTGLRHTAVTFASDYFTSYTAQAYSDAADMNGATWSNASNVYGMNSPSTSTTGTGNLWIGVRNTALSNTYDYNGAGPSYDDQAQAGSNGSINYYQVSIQGQVSSGTDTLSACLTADRVNCAIPATAVNLTTTLQTFTIGSFFDTPNGSNGGNGADPALFNANPPINRWHAFTHTGTVTADGTGKLTWVNGNYFDSAWGSSSFLRLSTVSAAAACAGGIAHNITSVTSGIGLLTADMPAAGTYFYCASNFGVLIKRSSPDSRTVTLENATFNISTSAGPRWISTADVPFVSGAKLNNGYYLVLAPSTGPQLLYFFDTTAGVSTLIGPTKPNSNASGSDQWFYFQIPGGELGPFDNTATASTGHLVFYNVGPDVNGKQVIIKTELSGTPAYQQNTINALMDETGATITNPDAYSVQVVNHGMTAKFTNVTPASLGKDLTAQMASVPGFNPAFMTVTYAGVANGKLYLQGRGNQDTISVFARLDPATGLIDHYTNSWSRPNCRWCMNHSGVQLQGDVNYILFGTDGVGSTGNSANGAGPWIVQTANAIAASPGAACPTNALGAPTAGTACDTFTLNSHGGSNPFEPYDPDPGPQETDFLQAANPGDTFCVTATTTCEFTNEIMVLVAKSGSQWTMWRPGNLNSAGTVAVAGLGGKNFFAWCTGVGTGIDSNGFVNGTVQGGPMWDTTTSGDTAVWYRDLYYVGGHADAKYNLTINGINVPGLFVEQCEEGIFCGIPGADRAANGYRNRQGVLPGILSTPPSYAIATANFAGVAGNDNAGSHLSVGGLASSFTDDRPFLGDGLNIRWGDGTTMGNPISGTTHVFKAMPAPTLNRKQILTAAVAGPHVLKDISSAATGNQISDATNFSYCVVLAANECRTGSSAGDVFVSATGRTYFGCYAGSSIVDVFAPGGNVQDDVCVFPGGVNANSVQQFSVSSDPVGWRYGRVLTYMAGKNKMDDAFANIRVMPDSSWAIGNERWGTTFRNEVVALKIPPLGLDTGVNRSGYIPVQVVVQGIAGADGVVADFGYAENGSDGISSFYCMSRQENCVANQASIGTTPFFWASETFAPMACAPGAACKLAIPAAPGHTLYYRIRRTLSGVTVAAETTQVQITP